MFLARTLRALRARTNVMLGLLPLVLALHPVHAQGTDASIRGLVTDSIGTAIAGAAIEVRNLSSGFSATLRSSDKGRFVATQLPLGGPYRITVRAVGYRPSTRAGVTLNIGSIVTTSVRMLPATTQ